MRSFSCIASLKVCCARQMKSLWLPIPSARHPYAASMTVVPPGPISGHTEVEVRIAVRNHSIKPARFELAVTIVSADGKSHSVYETQLEVPAYGQELTTPRFASGRYVGANQVHCRISCADNFVARKSWPLNVIASKSRALPVLQIGWIDPGAVLAVRNPTDPKRHVMTEQNLRDAIDRYSKMGINGFIITYPEDIHAGQGTYYPSRILDELPMPVHFDVLGTILSQSSKNGQRVFVGLGRGADLLLTWTGFDDPQRNRAALTHSMKIATELWSLYSHEPSFYGWYLTHEANDIAQASRAYYNPIIDFLRTFEADKPVLISPAGTPIISRDILAGSKVDIFAYQDAVGSGYVPYKNTFDPQRRIEMLDGVYSGYAKAHRESGKHLWSNLEIWQMDGPEYAASYPPEFKRVQAQLDIEKKHVDVITGYQLLGFMDARDSEVALGGKRANDLFEAYRAYYETTARQLGLTHSQMRCELCKT